jgi:hypothetical protein
MASRRTFLKAMGVAAAAAGAGYKLGALGESEQSLTMCGFLPDERALRAFVNAFRARTGSASENPTIEAEPAVAAILKDEWKQSGWNASNAGAAVIRATRLKNAVEADVLIRDGAKSIYDPNRDFDASAAALRRLIRGGAAELMVVASYRDESALTGWLKGEKTLSIERAGKEIERIPLARKRAELTIDGERGKTTIVVGDGSARVKTAACRHKLCQASGDIAARGEAIACAPNRLMLSVV